MEQDTRQIATCNLHVIAVLDLLQFRSLLRWAEKCELNFRVDVRSWMTAVWTSDADTGRGGGRWSTGRHTFPMTELGQYHCAAPTDRAMGSQVFRYANESGRCNTTRRTERSSQTPTAPQHPARAGILLTETSGASVHIQCSASRCSRLLPSPRYATVLSVYLSYRTVAKSRVTLRARACSKRAAFPTGRGADNCPQADGRCWPLRRCAAFRTRS